MMLSFLRAISIQVGMKLDVYSVFWLEHKQNQFGPVREAGQAEVTQVRLRR